MQHAQVVTFSNSKQKSLKKINLIVRKICVFQKRDNYIFSIYLFNLQENIEEHYTNSNYLYQLGRCQDIGVGLKFYIFIFFSSRDITELGLLAEMLSRVMCLKCLLII